MAGTGPVREYRRRRRSPGQLGRALVPVGGSLCYGLQGLLKDDSVVRWGSVACLLLTAGTLPWALLSLRRSFTRIDTNGVAVHGAFRMRRIPWSEVYELDVRRGPQSGRAGAYVSTMSGRRRSLPQLNEWQVEGLYAEVASLRRIGTRHGECTWEHTPVVEQALRRRAGGWRAASRTVIAGAVAWLAMLVVWSVLEINGRNPSAPLLLVLLPLAALAVLTGYFWRHRETYAPLERDAW